WVKKPCHISSSRSARVSHYRMTESSIKPAEFETLQTQMNQMDITVERLAAKVDSIATVVLQLSAAQQHQTSRERDLPILSLPDKWDGTHGSPDGLLATLAMTFECQPHRYATPRSRVALLTSLLTSRAQEWAAAMYNKRSEVCNDYDTFVNELRRTFVPPSGEALTEAQLLQLRQGNQTAAQYTSRVLLREEEGGGSLTLHRLSGIEQNHGPVPIRHLHQVGPAQCLQPGQDKTRR
uniref:Retrotransposon gag domain-containing protein n=1 Tax=Nothobranchius furzeri TaxID=105023 RepID=A0A8C6LZC5_NOTFU